MCPIYHSWFHGCLMCWVTRFLIAIAVAVVLARG